MTAINWYRLWRAITYYRGHGFQYIETPWVVSSVAAKATFPATEAEPEPLGLTNGNVPVGSAEQGFLELMLTGKLKPGCYVSAGPCFRPHDEGKPHHQAQFFKVEIIEYFDKGTVIEDTWEGASNLIKSAHALFIEVGADPGHLISIPTPHGFDLELNGLEVGSYGTRSVQGHTWEYGTGLAEPRFTEALALKR